MPIFKKAFDYDNGVIFYYDSKNAKYVAKGGSLSWRLNNPGLISSHSLTAREFKAIGSCKKFAIFSNALIGADAHRAWLIFSKYFNLPLIEIAKYYDPAHPKSYLTQLCSITHFAPTIKPQDLRQNDFEQLLLAIRELAGFKKENKGTFYPLSTITGKFHSHDQKIDLYLIDHEKLLTRSEATDLINAHKLDAVIIHKQDGTIYLRSRPGHHFDQIHLPEAKTAYKKDFKDAIRELGKERKGQCIWGYINGIFTSPQRAQHCAILISKHAEGERVWSLINDATGANWGGIKDLLPQTFHKITETKIVKNAHQFFKFLIDLSDKDPLRPPVIVFAHSQGALIADLALNYMSSEERNQIHIFTLGGACFIAPDKAHPDSHNYFSIADKIPLFASKESCRLLLKLAENKKKGLTPSQIVDECIKEDLIDYQQESFIPEPINQFREKQQKYYQNELTKVENVTVLERTTSDFCEHSFDLPSYQIKIKEIIDRYRKAEQHHGS